MANLKMRGKAGSLPSGLAMGAAVSIGITIFICGIGAMLVSAERIPQEQMGYCSVAALILGAMLGALTAWRKIQRQKMMICLLSGGVYFLLLVATSITFFDGRLQGMGVTLATIMTGSVIAVFMTNSGLKQKKGMRHRKSHR